MGLLGHGGMGTVWRAEQQSTKREVALKVLGWMAFGSEKARARFEREVELASRLEHPHITRIYESGLYHGVYYYAMELVKGAPLDEYATGHGLDRRQVLSLVRTACRAVQHAHQRSVIHRDLKPSNILVTEDGQPHVLDFGLAKAFQDEDAALTVSASGDVVGTPAYMSPEQAVGRMDLVDTRSDVYSLGVIAYQLLTGALPHAMTGTRNEVLRRIAGEEPRRPRAAAKGIDGELEALLLKALAQDPDSRYASAGDLADDVDRYLAGEPLLAKAPTTFYFLRKRARRHRVPLAVAGGVLVLLAGMAIWSHVCVVDERGNAIRARDDARHEAEKATAVTGFLNETLTSTDPTEALGREVTVRDVLDKAGRQIEARFSGQPHLMAEIQQSLAIQYAALGDYEAARALLASAVALRQRLLGDGHADTLTAMYHLGSVLRRQGKASEAAQWLRRVLAGRSETLGKDHPDTLRAMNELAKALAGEGKAREGEDLQRLALATAQRTLGKEHRDTLALVTALADALWEQGNRGQALPLYKQAFETRVGALGQDHPDTMSSMDHLASALWDQGRRDEALLLYRQLAGASRRALGEGHPGTLRFLSTLADALTALGRYDEAQKVHEEELDLRRRAAQGTLPSALVSLNELANDLYGQGSYAEAEQLHTAVLRIQQRVLGEEDAQTLVSESNLANDKYCQGDYREAEDLHRKVLAVRQRVLGDDAPKTVLSMRDLANDLFAQDEYAEAEEWYARVLEACRKRFGKTHPETLRAMRELASALEAQDKGTEANDLRKGSGEPASPSP